MCNKCLRQFGVMMMIAFSLSLDRYEEPLNAACSEQIQFSTKDLLLERTLERKHDAKMQKSKVNNCLFKRRIHIQVCSFL